MIIKFKLLGEYSAGEDISELQVAECAYKNQTISKIILGLSQESKSLIRDGINKSFIIKNIQESEVESTLNTLKINSANAIITSIKTDFLFAASQIRQFNSGWEIELAFTHLWNGERIKKIHILDASNQYESTIEKNKNRYLFQLVKVDISSSIDQTNKILTIYETNFQGLSVATPLQIELKEVPVKKLKVLNSNAYLFDAQEILANWGLRDYEKIELVTNKKIHQGEIINFVIPDLQIILRRDEEDKILRVGQNYHSLTKFQLGLEVSVDDLAGEEIQKFLAKYRSDGYQARINNCQNSQKYLVILDRVRHQLKTPDDLIEKLIKQQKNLSHQLEIFVDQTEFKKKVTILREQNSDQIDQLWQELKKIDQEFLTIEKEINKHSFLVNEYLQQNWILALQSDSRFKQLLVNYNLSISNVLDNLTWREVHGCLQEDGTFDYSALERLIQETKTQLSTLNDLGYKLTEITPGGEYEEWNRARIKKSEATEAIYLGYSPTQWEDPQYQEYRKISRVLADGIIETLRRKWVPPLTETHKKIIKSSRFSFSLIDNIMEVQRESHLAQAKVYFKNVIDQELKKFPEIEPNELGSLITTYEKEINKQDDWKSLNFYIKKVVEEIKKIRSNKAASIEELKEQAKKNISETLTKFKLRAEDLHSRHQNWSSDIEKMENKSQVSQYEQDLVLLLEEINFLLRQKWFPNLDPGEREKIKQVEDTTGLKEQILTLSKEKKVWLTNWQINSWLWRYHELQNENKQNYFLQWRALNEINFLLKFAGSLNEKQAELQKNLLNILVNLQYLPHISSLQRKFNEIDSPRKKEETLQNLQKSFQKWAEEGELNEKEMASRAEIETKLNLIQQGEVVEKISVLNERQKKLDLLDLPQEASDENETQTEKNFFDRLSQQILTLLAVGGLILIFLWRWYRKKREEDPFW